ncbi:alkaline phosphatase [Cryptosporangium aurantiacum]|uniref:Alkaline phosphatase n=1 Tax=Cryptosporangium aurantiacum TaxID=134849 RepID=A0A1M7RDK0_9ACTN|nr:alkaline phosphatase [Cryptosporangium aurantiacum]SHN44251.1 alkaline phosphatase [Cryptosporangium aurantiacum]
MDAKPLRWLAATVTTGVLVAVGATTLAADASNERQKARSVIFVNGDGMGPAHREAARLALEGLDGQLVMDSLPVSGQLTTSPDDPANPITDSAAGATAWTIGQRTYNGSIGYDVNKRPVPTLGYRAKQAGKATGLVTTAQVTDASPAAWFANVPDRGQQDEIARQYIDVSKPDVILGGGEDWWLPAGNPGAYPDKPAEDPTEGSRSTKGDLIAIARQAGYRYVSTAAQLQAAPDGRLLGLFANQEMFQQREEGQGDVYSPVVSLATMTSKALATLKKDRDGFFLLIEEEGVDEFSHDNNAARMLQSMGELEKAVAVAKAYVNAHPDTLLVITGDHECGGLTVEDTGTTDESGDAISKEDGPFAIPGSPLKFNLDWTTSGHTGVDVPVTAAGPYATLFTGKHPNTHVHEVLSKILTK